MIYVTFVTDFSEATVGCTHVPRLGELVDIGYGTMTVFQVRSVFSNSGHQTIIINLR